MAALPFVSPRFIGDRFAGHSMPLEVLADLASLDELVKDLAKWHWMNDHEDRKRTPRGFLKDIRLSVIDINAGSAIPEVVLEGIQEDDKQAIYFERARNSFLQALEAAESGASILDAIPERFLGYFDKLGRHLGKNERIEFTAPSGTQGHFDQPIRRRMLLASSKIKELSEDLLVRGRIPELDWGPRTFHLELASGRRVKGPIESQHEDAIRDAMNAYDANQLVAIRGIGWQDRNGELVRIESIEEISTLDPLDVGARIDQLRLLGPGWFEGRGVRLNRAGLDWFEEHMEGLFDEQLPLPRVFPTPTNELQLEWEINSMDATLLVDLDELTAAWHVLDHDSEQDEAQELDLSNVDGWVKLNELVAALDPELIHD